MASNLAQIFRYGVRADSQVPLAEEIGIVRRYLEIQRIRFPDRFEVDICVQKEAETIFVPKMILQPIVENAVQHGLELAESRGVLRIEAFVEPGNETRKLRILVSDNGVGIPPDVLEELREKLAGASSSDAEETGYHTGIGVINVHNRLRLMYGQDCGVTVDSREGRGTLVTITLCADTGKGRAQ